MLLQHRLSSLALWSHLTSPLDRLIKLLVLIGDLRAAVAKYCKIVRKTDHLPQNFK